jgi:hypothetical protein
LGEVGVVEFVFVIRQKGGRSKARNGRAETPSCNSLG